MSTSTPPPLPHDPNLKSQQPDPPVPLSSSADFPPDPLLKSGSFITANSPTPTPTANPPTTTTTATATAASTTTSAHTQNKKSPNQATSNGSESQSTPSKRRPPTAPPPETPEWLPPGWLVEDRVRSSGATAGLIDRIPEVTKAEIILNCGIRYTMPVGKHFFSAEIELMYYCIRLKSFFEGQMIEIIFTLWLIVFQERILYFVISLRG
ncbi:gibberellin-regulated protein 14-like isoform X2 [Pistacia vera]|uniref:gibberellin-regulated protein 14-like isoform X2 n=1 Tax=Pistacia vera TaxID=55513 RepID=UPI001262EE8F|nr:gibberellin-regulated protein 14-like isoform X2 [Pistacia vera]